MKVKAIITDLDGTAVDSPTQKAASQRLLKAIKAAEAAGIKICAATGRPLSFARPVMISMALKDPAIIAGGTRIIDPISEEELWGLDIPSDSLKQVIEAVKDLGYGALWNDSTEEDYLVKGGWPIDRLQTTENIYMFELCFVPHKEAVALVEKLKHIEGIAVVLVVSQREGRNDIHFINKEATKEHAIYEVQKLVGVNKDETVGIGDGHNDIHLFNAVGYKIAMGNAVEDLISEADRVIGSVKDDGLAEFIEELVRNKGQI